MSAAEVALNVLLGTAFAIIGLALLVLLGLGVTGTVMWLTNNVFTDEEDRW